MTRYQAYLDDPRQLAQALEIARQSTEPLWDLAVAAHRMIRASRHDDALRIFDVIITRQTLELSAYCNALWVVQRDNTGLPGDLARARRYLDACLPHAPMNPPIHLNAAGVLVELGDLGAAIDQLVRAARRDVPLDEALASPLLAPLRAHSPTAWAELEAIAAPRLPFAAYLARAGATPPVLRNDFDAATLAEHVTPGQVVDALCLALAEDDVRVRHRAARQLIWWRDEDGDDGHGGRADGELLRWYEALGAEIGERVTTHELVALIARDLDGDFVHEAARTYNILTRNGIWVDVTASVDTLGPPLARLLPTADDAVLHDLLDALSWLAPRPASHPALARHAIRQLQARVLAIADGPSLSDIATVQRDHLRLATEILAHAGALAPVIPALTRIVERARGELADRYLRDELVRAIARPGG